MGFLKLFPALAGGLALAMASGCASRPVAPPAPTLLTPTMPAPIVPPPTPPPAAVAPPAPTPAAPVAASSPEPFDQFKADRPAAARLLSDHPALEKWFRTGWHNPADPIQWDNQPPHTSPVAENEPSKTTHFTTIRVAPSLSAVDQLMALCYETCNSAGRPRVNQLADMAAHRLITREEFADGISRAEFGANLRLKETFPQLLPLTAEQVARDPLYKNMLQVPATYEEYLEWNRRTHNQTYERAQELYGCEYDALVRGELR